MADQNFVTLARQLVEYSVELKKGEKVLLDVSSAENQLAKALIQEVYRVGGVPFLALNDGELLRYWLEGAQAEQISQEAAWQLERMRAMDAYIGLRVKRNLYEMAGLDEEKLRLYSTLLQQPVHMEERVPHTKWVILRYPNDSMAQEAHLDTDAFAEFYFRVCNLDYARLSQAMTPLYDLIDKGREIRIVAPGTDLRFSIEGIGAVKCDGHRNIPDGEVYTAPVRDSVEGTIAYNLPSSHEGVTYSGITLTFSQGKIVEAQAGPNTERINHVFDVDEGARYVGEFAFGLNPHVLYPVNDILFDEKICGSIHFTPGACYDDADNGNKSSLHWDLVLALREEFGGGEIYCDGRLIQKNGRFCVPELEPLNPENLR